MGIEGLGCETFKLPLKFCLCLCFSHRHNNSKSKLKKYGTGVNLFITGLSNFGIFLKARPFLKTGTVFAGRSVDHMTGKVSALNLEDSTGAREAGLPGHVKMDTHQTVRRPLGSMRLIV